MSIRISEEWSRGLVMLPKSIISSIETEKKSMNSSSDRATALTKGSKFSQMHLACGGEKHAGLEVLFVHVSVEG